MRSKRLKRHGLLLALVLTGATTAQAAPLTPLDVGLGDVSVNKVPFLIAADKGLYAKFGLDVHQYITPGAAKNMAGSGVHVPPELVRADAGSAPILISGGAPMMTRAVKDPGQHRIVVAMQEDFVRDHIIAVPAIKSLQDLKGKKIGYSGWGAVTSYDDVEFVKKMGWDPQKDVTLVTDAANFDALRSGKVDAISADTMMANLPKGDLKDLGDLAVYKIPLAGSGVMVQATWLPANRDTVARFVKAMVVASAMMRSDRSVFDAAVGKWFKVTDKKTLDLMFAAAKEIPVKPYPSVAGFENAMVVFDMPEMKGHKASEYYDSSFIADLDRSGFLDHPLR